MSNHNPTVNNPCIRQCCLDDNDVCMGCFRTFNDMRIWHHATQNEKVDILNLAKERKIIYMKKHTTR